MNIDAVALRRITRLLWIQVGGARNPLLTQVLSSEQSDTEVNAKYVAWNTEQVELGRALFQVVLRQGAVDLALINRALDFLNL